MEVLNKETVHMKDRSYVESVISQMIKGGASQLQVISDFDQTLTRTHKDGVICESTYGILESADCVTEEYKYKSNCLYEYYHPIEVDPYLSKDEKIKHMVEWYTKANDLMPLSGISKDKIPEMVKCSKAYLRDGCVQLFESLNRHDVPLLIFSAGVGDVLKEVLIQRKLLLPNMKIIANFMKYDEKDKFLGFKNDVILHTYNKNQSSIQNADYFHTLKHRSNIVLLGDSSGDPEMSEGAANVNVILKIGYLNHRIEENLPLYLNIYDIVLEDDQTVDVANGIMEKILQ